MSTRKSCKHIKSVLKHMQDQGVFVATRNETPDLFCAVCRVFRSLRNHGDTESLRRWVAERTPTTKGAKAMKPGG